MGQAIVFQWPVKPTKSAAITKLYQANRAPTWIRRGVLACAVISPKVVLVGDKLGAAKVTRFVKLNDSNRICKYLRSPNVNFFNNERSRFFVGSRRRLLNCELNVRMLSAGCSPEIMSNRFTSNVLLPVFAG